jgi:DNA modification methylase
MIEDALKKVKIETMVDIFLGSGTSAEVATALGIKWIGFDINKTFENDIKKRIELGGRHRAGMATTL